MVDKEQIKEFLEPEQRKILFSVLIFLMLEIVLYLMTQACAIGTRRSYCLLDFEQFLSASILALLISYFISSAIRPEKRSTYSLFLIFLGIAALALFVGFFVYPILKS